MRNLGKEIGRDMLHKMRRYILTDPLRRDVQNLCTIHFLPFPKVILCIHQCTYDNIAFNHSLVRDVFALKWILHTNNTYEYFYKCLFKDYVDEYKILSHEHV